MKEEVPALTEYENKVLTMLSLEVLNGKRKTRNHFVGFIIKARKS